MPKTKKEKKTNQKWKQVIIGAHALKDALVLGNRMGETRGAFKRSLSVADETPLRERESTLNPLEKAMLPDQLPGGASKHTSPAQQC